jgi:hypothetical protein
VKDSIGIFALQYTFRIIKSLQHELYNMPREKGTNYDKADRELLDELHWRKDGSFGISFLFWFWLSKVTPQDTPLDHF